MSVTFQAELGIPTGFRVGCSCEDNRGPVFGTYADAEEFYVRHDLLNTTIAEVLVGCDYAGREGFCEEGHCFIRAVFPDEGPSLNVANGNAIKILASLHLGSRVVETGFGPAPADCGGSLDAEDFLGRVLAAEIMSVGDPGRPEEITVVDGGPTIVSCGTPEGYLDDKLAALREIAEFAQAHGRAVVWG
jgi:hypothetical protein